MAEAHEIGDLRAGSTMHEPPAPRVWHDHGHGGLRGPEPPPGESAPTPAEIVSSMIEQDYARQHEAARFATTAAQRGTTAMMFRAAA
jgi:hypothetical protein